MTQEQWMFHYIEIHQHQQEEEKRRIQFIQDMFKFIESSLYRSALYSRTDVKLETAQDRIHKALDRYNNTMEKSKASLMHDFNELKDKTPKVLRVKPIQESATSNLPKIKLNRKTRKREE